MVRITVSLADATLSQIDEEAERLKVSRSQWAADALDAYLHQRRIASDADVNQLMQDAHHLKDDVMQLQQQLDAKDEELEIQRQELDRLKLQLEQASQLWGETRSLRSENSQLKRELEEAKSTTLKLKDELLKRQVDADQARAEVEISRVKLDSYLNALKVKDDDIAFLRGHVSQLSEKITPALPPSQEEAMRKRWYQFWRRG